jgi:ribosomal protein L14
VLATTTTAATSVFHCVVVVTQFKTRRASGAMAINEEEAVVHVAQEAADAVADAVADGVGW